MTTFSHSQQQTTLEELILLREDSPANHSAKQDQEKEQTMIATSGQKCLELYELSSQRGSSLKTCVASLLSSKEWCSSRCVLIWKPLVTKSNRLLFQLAQSTPRTKEKEFGFLLTPSATNIEGGVDRYEKRKAYRASVGRQWSPGGLAEQIKMLPTLNARDGGRDQSPKRDRMPDVILRETGWRLQPNFAAWMMGYPLNWTDLNSPKQEIERNS